MIRQKHQQQQQLMLLVCLSILCDFTHTWAIIVVLHGMQLQNVINMMPVANSISSLCCVVFWYVLVFFLGFFSFFFWWKNSKNKRRVQPAIIISGH